MKEFFGKLVQRLFKRRMNRIHAFFGEARDIQEEQLTYILHACQDTEFGRKFNFASIDSVKTFQDLVPINSYEDLFPYIERMRSGEENVLWPGLVPYFSKSSGTTNDKSKYIPMTQETLQECHYKGGKDMLALYFSSNPKSELLSGKSIAVGGSVQEDVDTGIESGDISAVIMKNLPKWAQYVRVPRLDTAIMSDWEVKSVKLVEESLDKDIRSLSGAPSWVYAFLQKVLEKTGKEKIIDVWPNLEVFFTGGVSMKPFKKLFDDIVGKEIYFVGIYNASEGYIGIQDDLSTDEEFLLMLDYGIFYEFIPLNQYGKSDPKVLTIEETEIGETYALVMTTNAGLFRYVIGDTVMITSKSPHRIKIVGRTKQFINVYGEELMVHNAETAIAKVSDNFGVKIKDFTAGPIFETVDSKGGHQWIIEFEKEPEDLESFTESLDKALQEENSDYEAKRSPDFTILERLDLVVAPTGTFYEWMKSRGKLGGQHKVPRLANNREYLDSILKLIEE